MVRKAWMVPMVLRVQLALLVRQAPKALKAQPELLEHPERLAQLVRKVLLERILRQSLYPIPLRLAL
jgi:hypothetical protein